MESSNKNTISCVSAVYSAWDKMEDILFRPFEAGKWFLLGFSAWLANLGQGMNMGFNYSFPQSSDFSSPSIKGNGGESTLSILQQLFDSRFFSVAFILMIAAIAILIVFIAIILALVMKWVRSRGTFVFIHNLIAGKTQIVQPWNRYSRQGNSLFLLRILVGFIVFISVVLCLAIGILLLLKSIMAGRIDALGIGGIIFMLASVLLIVIASAAISLSIESFIVPIMFKRMGGAWDAMLDFISLVNLNPFAFIRFFLMYFLLWICATTAIIVFLVSTCCFCCMGFILLSLPYIWAVLLLPVLVFFRLYSIEFLAQFGPGHDLRSSFSKVEPGSSTDIPVCDRK
ncbi:MAG TPA: hypothetical protein DET40_03835 [Lentisphaeria bacterium]|nr:MAG: hypothetical protein A2X45_23675 [Lentisphaerae bacterium GWF2_50_93]HCE42658.1 hypothetical protein [Lentisphaeria bacterium]